MTGRRVLYVDSDQVEAYSANRGTIDREAAFQATEEGLDAFSVYLARNRSALFYLLADVVEEDFQLETLPHVQGADRRAMLARKTSQLFFGTPFSACQSLGRERGGRRDERFLFAGLTHPETFEPWLQKLRQAEAQVAGLFSLPQLAPAVGVRVVPANQRYLLVAQTSAGIRQAYVEERKLRFSRLAPTVSTDPDSYAAACSNESVKTYQYLVGQRVISRGTVLPVVVLAEETAQPSFERWCKNTDELSYETVSLAQARRALGLRHAPAEAFSAPLFMHALVRLPPETQFAPPPVRHLFRLWQVRSALTATGGVALAACLLFAGKQHLDGVYLRDEAHRLRAQTEVANTRYRNILGVLPTLPTALEDLRAVTDRYHNLDKSTVPLLPMLQKISQALDATPDVDLDRLEWSLGSGQEGDNGDPRRRGAPTAEGRVQYTVALISGRLHTDLSGDQRAQFDAVNAFVGALRRDGGLTVSIVRQPFDIEPGKALRSSDANTVTEAPRFVVRAALKIE